MHSDTAELNDNGHDTISVYCTILFFDLEYFGDINKEQHTYLTKWPPYFSPIKGPCD